jgi:hypothetical protein
MKIKIKSTSALARWIKAIENSLNIARSEQYEAAYMGEDSLFYDEIVEKGESTLRLIERRVKKLSPKKQAILKPLIERAWNA